MSSSAVARPACAAARRVVVKLGSRTIADDASTFTAGCEGSTAGCQCHVRGSASVTGRRMNVIAYESWSPPSVSVVFNATLIVTQRCRSPVMRGRHPLAVAIRMRTPMMRASVRWPGIAQNSPVAPTPLHCGTSKEGVSFTKSVSVPLPRSVSSVPSARIERHTPTTLLSGRSAAKSPSAYVPTRESTFNI